LAAAAIALAVAHGRVADEKQRRQRGVGRQRHRMPVGTDDVRRGGLRQDTGRQDGEN